MEDLDPFNEPHSLDQEQMSSIQPKTSKSYTHFLSKSFIILLVLVLLPFFPSQAPEFINKSIFTKFWELFHLFVIGTAVSYGLFSRRNVKLDSITQSSIDSSRTYLSGISHVSSFFEDGFQNSYGFDEKKMIQAWDSDESSVLDECKDYRSFRLQNGFENPNLFNEKNVTQARNSQYFIGESMVFVANGNYVLDKWGKPKSGNGYKSLNLPVRSLRSRIVDAATSYETENEGGFSSNLKGSDGIDKNNKVTVRGLVPVNLEERLKETAVPSPIRWGSRSGRMELREEVSRIVDTATSYETKNESGFSSTLKGSNGIHKNNKVKIRGLVPLNLEEKFKETIAPSPICWGSRSRRMELSEEVGNVKPPSHSKPPSDGEIELECPKSPVRSSVPTPTIVSPELSNSEIEGFKRKENLQGSSSPASQPSLEPLNGKTSFNRSNRRRFSIGSSTEVNVEKSSENNLKGFGNSEKEDLLLRENKGVDSLNSDVKPATLVKGLTRGKSVRTIRSNDKFVELRKREEVCSRHTDEKGEKKCNKVESGSLNITSRRAGLENLAAETNIDDLSCIQNSRLGKNRSGDEQNYFGSTIVESENVLKKEFENLQLSASEKETRPDIVNDTQSESDEVDKKAGEFIAKFREQIRLQRVASMKGLNCW